MCGIVGYVGSKSAEAILVDGLSRLEYRGYDSAGLATLDAVRGNKTEVRRAVGKLKELRELLAKEPCAGTIGVGQSTASDRRESQARHLRVLMSEYPLYGPDRIVARELAK